MAIPPGPTARALAALNLVPREGGLPYARVAEAPAAFISRLDPGVRARGLTIVHDSHLTATARLADVVLPAVTGYEKRGTTVNLEGRLLELEQAALSAGEAADLIRTLSAVSEALGLRAPVRGLKGARELAAQRLGIKLGGLPERGVIHPLRTAHVAPTEQVYTPQLWTERMQPSIQTLIPANLQPLPMLGAAPVGGDD